MRHVETAAHGPEKISSTESPTPTPPGFLSTKTWPPNPLFQALPGALGVLWGPRCGFRRRGVPTAGLGAPRRQEPAQVSLPPAPKSAAAFTNAERQLLSGSETVQLRGSPSPPCPAASQVLVGLAEPREPLCWEMPAPPAVFSPWFPTREPLQGCVLTSAHINPPLCVTLGRAQQRGLRLRGYPHGQLGTQGRASHGVPREGVGSPGCCQPPEPPAPAIRGCCKPEPPVPRCQGWFCKPGAPSLGDSVAVSASAAVTRWPSP